MLNFLFPFFLKISETLKAYISGTETDIIGYAALNYHTEHGVKNKWEWEWGDHASQPRESTWIEGSRNPAEPSNQATELNNNNNNTPPRALDGMIS